VGWNTRLPQFADARVRRAITLATHRQQVIDGVLRGYGRLANAGVPPFHWGHLPGIEDSLAFDPDEARRLLEEAGWTDRNGDGVRRNEGGVPLEFTLKYHPGSVQRQAIAEIMQSQLAEIGVVVRPQVVEWVTLVGQITNPASRDFEGVVMSWVPEFKVDDSDLFHSERRESIYAWAGLEDPRMDRILDTLQLVVDRAEALPLWHEYQLLLLELQPYTYVYFPRGLSGIGDRLRGVRMDARGEWVGVTDWWIPADRRRR
jgi:peptide/nickel transport system substrate-binding protein